MTVYDLLWPVLLMVMMKTQVCNLQLLCNSFINQSLELDDNELQYPVECSSDTDDPQDLMSKSILLFSSVSLIILFY